MFHAVTRFLISAVVFSMFATTGWSIQQALLNDHFNIDPQEIDFPYITHRLDDPPRIMGWGHNPRNWPLGNWFWPVGRQQLSNAGWGWQDLIFNTHITPEVEFQGAIWCAYCDFNGPNNPRWPEDEDYLSNMNAWLWWGPIENTTGWVDGAVSFWMFIDMRVAEGDSLSVIVCEEDFVTATGADFRRNCAIGLTFPRATQGDWEYHDFHFDELTLDGEEFSYLDFDEPLYVAWVWHSDAQEVTGDGAFIDDVVISWDDGLYEIIPEKVLYGYLASEDSMIWVDDAPTYLEEVYFRVDWSVDGPQETPPFDVRCILNDEVVYTEEVVGDPNYEGFYSTVTREPWHAAAGEHVLRWELDAPLDEGGQVEETDEDNNALQMDFEIEWTPAPVLSILHPEEVRHPVRTRTYDIHYAIADSNEFDDRFRLLMFWTDDTSGFADNPDTLFTFGEIFHNYNAGQGEALHTWDVLAELNDEESDLKAGMEIWLVGLVSDDIPGNARFGMSAGTLLIDVESAPSDGESNVPASLELNGTYPNPFNRELRIDFSVPRSETVELAAYDLSGRLIQTLHSGVMNPGGHSVAWRPVSLGAGIYLLKLTDSRETVTQKAVYLP